MKTEKYYVMDIKAKDGITSPSQIYRSLSKVSHLNIPFIPIKSNTLDHSAFVTKTPFANLSKFSDSSAKVQIALPQTVDHMKIFSFVSEVNDSLDVTLLGEQHAESLTFENNPENQGMDHFILGKYE